MAATACASVGKLTSAKGRKRGVFETEFTRSAVARREHFSLLVGLLFSAAGGAKLTWITADQQALGSGARVLSQCLAAESAPEAPSKFVDCVYLVQHVARTHARYLKASKDRFHRLARRRSLGTFDRRAVRDKQSGVSPG